jgi:hypothetical protein
MVFISCLHPQSSWIHNVHCQSLAIICVTCDTPRGVFDPAVSGGGGCAMKTGVGCWGVQRGDEGFGRLARLLLSLVELRSLEDDVFSYNEVFVKRF